jgi:hypothetical protein
MLMKIEPKPTSAENRAEAERWLQKAVAYEQAANGEYVAA